ncbi:uncharacterized protein LOC125568097 [Nematostella vectensis]|uniref:uncharacterized protein LOC125568097 n=1 Tax=Nematostella vectensis TaxID=45351 RepID=UPI002077186E|nr:uncharacterized protein LOC125568097 [Nematostella vectensis]
MIRYAGSCKMKYQYFVVICVFGVSSIFFFCLSGDYRAQSWMRNKTSPRSENAFSDRTNDREERAENSTSSADFIKKIKVTVFMGIITAPKRVDRRTAIRETWLTTLDHYSEIGMRFFTDGLGLSKNETLALQLEQTKYGDLEFLPLKGGVRFTYRLLWMMFLALEKYDFKFILKTDDDYFVCLEHLNFDIRFRLQEKLLVWGWFHCEGGSQWTDEGLIIFGRDFVDELVKLNKTLQCHPYGDQAIGLWINAMASYGLEVTFFADNTRLLHENSLDSKPYLKNSDLCTRLLGIHQAYPKQMREYWSLVKTNWFNVSFAEVPREPYQSYCPYPRRFEWRYFLPPWRHEPKPCWGSEGIWSDLEKFVYFAGRQESGK